MKICQIMDYENRGGGHRSGIEAWIRLAEYTQENYDDFEFIIRDRREVLEGDVDCDLYQGHRAIMLIGDEYAQDLNGSVGLWNVVYCLHGYTSGHFYRWDVNEIYSGIPLFSRLDTVRGVLTTSTDLANWLKFMGVRSRVRSFTTEPRPVFKNAGAPEKGGGLCAVGRISYEKGADFLLELSRRGRDIDYLGRTIMTCPEELESSFFNSGINRLNPARDEDIPIEKMPDFYQNHTVLVHPSRMESSPLILKEAITCGVPVVAFGVGDTRKIVRGANEKYECGVVVPYKLEMDRSGYPNKSVRNSSFSVFDEDLHGKLLGGLDSAIDRVVENWEYYSDQCRQLVEDSEECLWSFERNSERLHDFYTLAMRDKKQFIEEGDNGGEEEEDRKVWTEQRNELKRGE